MDTGDYFWFPWYPECYRLDTAHLTAEQDGIPPGIFPRLYAKNIHPKSDRTNSKDRGKESGRLIPHRPGGARLGHHQPEELLCKQL